MKRYALILLVLLLLAGSVQAQQRKRTSWASAPPQRLETRGFGRRHADQHRLASRDLLRRLGSGAADPKAAPLLPKRGRFVRARRQNRPCAIRRESGTTPRPFYLQVPLLVNCPFQRPQPPPGTASAYGGVGTEGAAWSSTTSGQKELFGDRGVLRLDLGSEQRRVRRENASIWAMLRHRLHEPVQGGSLFSYESRTRAIEKIRNDACRRSDTISDAESVLKVIQRNLRTIHDCP